MQNLSHAIIFAMDTPLPKNTISPLENVGGLALIERSLLILKKTDFSTFTIMANQVEKFKSFIKKDKRLKEFQIQYCALEAASQLQSIENRGTLIIYANYLFNPKTIQKFISQLDLSKSAAAVSNSNEIDSENPALFYLPNFSNMKSLKPKSLTKDWLRANATQTINIKDAFWAAIVDKQSKKIATKKLLQTLIKITDGPISKKLNRKISTRISLFLTYFKVTPNAMTTFVFLLTLLGAYWAASGEYYWIAIGGIIFQIASILDGCDGELARLTFRSTHLGAWYDTMTDNLRYIVFFAALGIGSYEQTGLEIYPYAITSFVIIALIGVIRMAVYVWQQKGPLTNLVVSEKINQNAAANPTFWSKVWQNIRGIEKQDSSAFIAFILCLLGLHTVMFWLVAIAVYAWSFIIIN